MTTRWRCSGAYLDELNAKSEARRARLERTTHYIYRAYDSLGELLYVGCTVNLAARMSAHRNSAEWWPFVTSHQVEHRDGFTAGREAEQQAINTESPWFNREPANQFTCTGDRLSKYLSARAAFDSATEAAS